MYRIWSERSLSASHLSLLNGAAIVVGTGDKNIDDPWASVAETQAIIAGGRLKYDAFVMDRAPQLRVISRTGIGIDKVSVREATARGIAVCNAPGAPTISTAEHTIGLIFAVAKQLKWSDQAIRKGGRQDFFNDFDGLELYGKHLGLVGLGRIGSRVAALALGLGMRVVAFDPFVSFERAQGLGVRLCSSLEEVLGQADVVSLHLPLLPETRGIINAERLAQMKRGAILINAARGGLVDETGLLRALESGHLFGAGLDVFEVEPPRPDHPLLARNDVIASPHVASASRAGKDRLWRTAIRQALQVLRGEKPPHLLNPEVWPFEN